MAINRFYKGSQSNYQSQFVPKNLPADLMIKGALAKQAKADEMMALSNTLEDWTQRALDGYDTEYVKAFQKETEAFAREAMSQDRTSPEFQRKYLSLMDKINKDEGLKKIKAAVVRDDAFWERQEKLIEAGDDKAAAWNKANYMYTRDRYTATGGKGFTGKGLDAELVVTGVDLWEGKTKYFKELKDSGADSIKQLASGISYKTGFTGVTPGRIKDQLKNSYDDYITSAAGRQERTKTLLGLGYVKDQYNALSGEEKAEVDQKLKQAMEQNFLEAGLTYVRGKHTTNIDDAYNTQRGEAKKKEEEYGAVLATSEAVGMVKTKGATRDAQKKELWNNIQDINRQLRLHKEAMKTGSSINLLTDERVEQLQGERTNLRERRNVIVNAHNEDWRRVNEQAQFNSPDAKKFTTKSNKQEKLLDQISDPEIRAEISRMMTNGIKDASITNYYGLVHESEGFNVGMATGKDGTLRPVFQGKDKKATPDQKLAQQILDIEREKALLGNNLNEYVDRQWNRELYQRGKGQSLVQQTTVQGRTDDKSMMGAYNRSISGNPAGYRFLTADGRNAPIPKNAAVKFKGVGYTMGDQLNIADRDQGEENIGISGSVTFEQIKENADGTPYKGSSGTGPIQYETITLSVNAIPQGINQATNNDALSAEFYEVARVKRANGKFTEANEAETMARTLNSDNIYNNVREFSMDEDADITTIPVRSYDPETGKSESTYVEIKKSGPDFTAIFGNANNHIFKAKSVSALTAKIQEFSNGN